MTIDLPAKLPDVMKNYEIHLHIIKTGSSEETVSNMGTVRAANIPHAIMRANKKWGTVRHSKHRQAWYTCHITDPIPPIPAT